MRAYLLHRLIMNRTILFLILVQDLPDALSDSAILLADDVKLISARSKYGELHQNLEAALQWSDDRDLPLNASKHSHVSIGGPSSHLTLSDGTKYRRWIQRKTSR